MENSSKIGQVEFDFYELSVSRDTLDSLIGIKNSVSEKVHSLYMNLQPFLSYIWTPISTFCKNIKEIAGNVCRESGPSNIKEAVLQYLPVAMVFPSAFILSSSLPQKHIISGGGMILSGFFLWNMHLLWDHKVLKRKMSRVRKFSDLKMPLTQEKKLKICMKHDILDRANYVSTLIHKGLGLFIMGLGVLQIYVGLGQYYQTDIPPYPQDLVDELFKCPDGLELWKDASKKVGQEIAFEYADLDKYANGSSVSINAKSTSIYVNINRNQPFISYFRSLLNELSKITYFEETKKLELQAVQGNLNCEEFTKTFLSIDARVEISQCNVALNCIKNRLWSEDSIFMKKENCYDFSFSFNKQVVELIKKGIEKQQAIERLMTEWFNNQFWIKYQYSTRVNEIRQHWNENFKSIYESKQNK